MCIVWLPFLPGSTSALVAVFLAGCPSALNFFLLLFFLFFLYLFFLFFVIVISSFNFYYFLLFLLIFLLFSCFGPLSRSLWVSAALLDDFPGLVLLFVDSSGQPSPICKLYVFYPFILVSPVLVSIFFRVFRFWTAHAI